MYRDNCLKILNVLNKSNSFKCLFVTLVFIQCNEKCDDPQLTILYIQSPSPFFVFVYKTTFYVTLHDRWVTFSTTTVHIKLLPLFSEKMRMLSSTTSVTSVTLFFQTTKNNKKFTVKLNWNRRSLVEQFPARFSAHLHRRHHHHR